MHISAFDYDLPPELIAQQPARPRDASRMLVLHRPSGRIEHRSFRDLPTFLRSDDMVVLNDTRVIRARLRGRRHPGGGKAEVLLLSSRADGLWEALVTPGRRIPPGRQIIFGQDDLRAEVMARTPSGARLLRFSRSSGSLASDEISAALEHLGDMPLPPYIHSPIADEDDYQTVYARVPGASAAPTAGLHFTPNMLAALRARVHAVTSITLHVGVGTFRPIRTDNVEDHTMHAERYAISQSAADLITKALAEGRRVVAIGTSTTRALEAATADGVVRAGHAETHLFIRPGYQFQTVGALLTNFHLPRSTVLVLVCAMADRDQVLRAYREAAALKYRFLSFGDAMLII
jgi:S-adenosylmethionine:tRNA ribosyltransferase-isomerase